MIQLASLAEVFIRLREEDHVRATAHTEEQLADKINTALIHDQSTPNAPGLREAFQIGNLGEITIGYLLDMRAPLPPRGHLDLTTAGGLRLEIKGTRSSKRLLTARYCHKRAQMVVGAWIVNDRWAKAYGWVTTKEYYAQRDKRPGPGKSGGYWIVGGHYRGIGRLLKNEEHFGGRYAPLRRCAMSSCVHVISGENEPLCPTHEKRGGQLRFL